MRRSQRHPALETAVFAAALLLAVFIVRELWHRRSLVRPKPTDVESSSDQPAVLNPTHPVMPPGMGTRRTELAVEGVAPIKLTRVQRRRPKTEVVPVPK